MRYFSNKNYLIQDDYATSYATQLWKTENKT